MRHVSRFILPAMLFACAGELAHIELKPEGETVEFATEPPSANAYELVGQVTGLGESHDMDAAAQSAKNDLRNKAAAMGASLVTIDLNLGEPMPLQNKTRVKVVGRAYKSVD